MKYLFSVFLIAMIAVSQVLSSSSNIFEDHKLQTYSPMKVGVTDLFFDIRVDGLLEKVKKTTALTDLEDLYFRVYWAYPDQYKIVVEGIPVGFKMLKRDLKNQVKAFVDLIFLDDFVRQFERVPFIKDPKSKKSYIKKMSKSDVGDVKINLNNKGIIEEINSMSPYSRIKTTFEHNLRSWSKGKYVMSKVSIKQNTSGMVSEKNIDIERSLYSGMGFPKNLTVEQKLKRGEQVINSSSTTYRFTNYNINTGKSAGFMKGEKK